MVHPPKFITQCVSYFDIQPKNEPFAQMRTCTARLCNFCTQTAIFFFMESQGLDLFHGMMLNIPIVLVDENDIWIDKVHMAWFHTLPILPNWLKFETQEHGLDPFCQSYFEPFLDIIFMDSPKHPYSRELLTLFWSYFLPDSFNLLLTMNQIV